MRSIILVTALLFTTLTFAQRGPYSVSETPIGTLLENPAAAAVLEEHMPGFTSNPGIGLVQGITLVEVQGFRPEAISDEQLSEIEVDLAALPAN